MEFLLPKKSHLMILDGEILIELDYTNYTVHCVLDITDAYNCLDLRITEDEDYMERQLEHIGDPVDIVDKCFNGGAELKVCKIWV